MTFNPSGVVQLFFTVTHTSHPASVPRAAPGLITFNPPPTAGRLRGCCICFRLTLALCSRVAPGKEHRRSPHSAPTSSTKAPIAIEGDGGVPRFSGTELFALSLPKSPLPLPSLLGFTDFLGFLGFLGFTDFTDFIYTSPTISSSPISLLPEAPVHLRIQFQ
jgi:hypothetical protein